MNSLGIFFLVALLQPRPAEVDRARQLFEAGSQAYNRGQYLLAVEAFQAAASQVDRPAILFSLAQAHRLQYFVDGNAEHLRRAVETYRLYLERVPEGGRRDHAVQHLSTLAPLLEQSQRPAEAVVPAPARLIISSSVEGAVARVDGGEPAPIPAAFEVAAGERRVVVEAPRHQPEARTVLAVTGSAVAVNVDPEPLPGRLSLAAPEGARLYLDGQRLGIAPLEAPVEVAPGRHVVVVTQRGRLPFDQPFEVGLDEGVEVAAHLETSNQRWVAGGVLGLAGALAATSGLWLGLTLDAQADGQALEDRRSTRGLTIAEARELQRLERTRDDRRDLTVTFAALAGAALTSGLLLWFFDEPEPPRPTLSTASRR